MLENELWQYLASHVTAVPLGDMATRQWYCWHYGNGNTGDVRSSRHLPRTDVSLEKIVIFVGNDYNISFPTT